MKIILIILIYFFSIATGSSFAEGSAYNVCYEINNDFGDSDYQEYDHESYESHSSDWEEEYEEESWPDYLDDTNDYGFNDPGISVSVSSKISISCFLYGDDGCQSKCNLQCTLYDCTPRSSCCDNSFHCNCDEAYSLGSDQITQSDMDFLEFNDLWYKTFEEDPFSNNNRKRIRADKQIEKYVLGLLRNAHIGGEDIKSLLMDKFPHWGDVWLMTSIRHPVKEQLLGAGKRLNYDDLNDHFDDLLELMETQPLDNIGKVKYRRRIRQFLQRITNTDDLEELLHLIKLSGNKKLYKLAKSVLKSSGYGFVEDGDTSGKKGLLKTIPGELEDADDDEVLEIAILNKVMSKSDDVSKDMELEKTYYTKSGITDTVQKGNLLGGNAAPVVLPANADDLANTSSIAKIPAANQNIPSEGALMAASGQSFNDYAQAYWSSMPKVDNKGYRVYYAIFDENGAVSHANHIPRLPFLENIPKTSLSSEGSVTESLQTSTSLSSTPPIASKLLTSSAIPPPPYMQGPPPPYMQGPPPPYAHGPPPYMIPLGIPLYHQPYSHPYPPSPPFAHGTSPPYFPIHSSQQPIAVN